MEFHILIETPENSGKYEATGEVFKGPVADALRQCVLRTQSGRRHGFFPMESVRIAPDMPPRGVTTSADETDAEPQSQE